MEEKDIAEQVVASMGSQIDLIFTLAVAICGGIVALIFQIALHNSKKEADLKVEWRCLLWLSFLAEGLSVLFGYLSRGAITANIPSIYKVPFGKIDTWGSASFPGFYTMKWLISLQFYTFLMGVLLLFILILKNLKKIA
jgi:hypothetical protein